MVENKPSLEALKIGSKVRELREKGRFTMHDMAAKTGIDKEQLAQIEGDAFMPPVATLLKLAHALGVSMAYFFEDRPGTERITLTRADERIRVKRRPHHSAGEVNYVYEALEIHRASKQMEPFMVEFPPQDTSEMVFTSHEGEEFIHLLEGTLEFRAVDRVEILKPGDSMYFESDLSHSLRCLGEKPARALVVIWSKPQATTL